MADASAIRSDDDTIVLYHHIVHIKTSLYRSLAPLQYEYCTCKYLVSVGRSSSLRPSMSLPSNRVLGLLDMMSFPTPCFLSCANKPEELAFIRVADGIHRFNVNSQT